MKAKIDYSVGLSFETISLPPFKDILILCRKCPHGKEGIARCLHLMAPNEFELIEVEHEHVEVILVSTLILKRMPAATIIEILAEHVFPYITHAETVKVDFHVKISIGEIKGTLEGLGED